jgi:putative PEP-CTERM system TPR-repeat lipoprotein
LYKKIIAICAVLFCIAGCNSKTKEELYADALQQSKNGNPNGAIVLLKNALEKDLNYLDARYQLAKAYMDAGKYEQAEKEFRKVLRQNPSRSDIKLDLARVYNATKKPDLAMNEAGEYLKAHPKSADALEIIGIAYAFSNKPDEAEKYLLQALKIEPQRIAAKLDLAGIYMAWNRDTDARLLLDQIIKGDPNNSRAYYLLAGIESSVGNKDKAIEIYQKLYSINKSDSNALYKSGLIYIDKGEIDKAEKMAGYLLQKFPDRAEGNRLKGLVSYYKKNFNEAISLLQASIRMQPNMEAYYFLGLSLYSRGELENALSQFRQILDHNPSFIQARLLTGMILLKQKRIDDSISEMTRILQADDKHALAHNLLGSAYMAKGMYEDGMKELSRATELDPRIIDAHLKKGLFHLSRGRTKEAETELNTAVKVAPEILNTRLLLSTYYVRQNNYAKAFAIIKEGINKKNGDAILYNSMASIRFAEHKPSEGLKLLQKAKETDPKLFASYFNLANYFAVTGEYEKSLSEYGAVLQNDPGNVKSMLSMAALLELQGRDNEAITFYTKAKDTKDPAAFIAMANYFLKKKDNGRAVNVLNEAIYVIPRNTAALELKGKVYLKGKQYKDAIKVFDDLEAILPERGLPLKITAYVMMKDIGKAVEQARRIINRKPNSAYGYMLLASIYESQNNLDQAVTEALNGLKVDRKNLQASMMLGNLYARKKDNNAAMRAFEDALYKNPHFAPAYFAQGTLLDVGGHKKEAIMKYRAALEKSGNYVPALNNLAYLYADGFGSAQEAVRLAVTAFKLEPGNPAIMDTLGYALLKNGRKADALKVLEKAATLLPENANAQYHLALALKENGDQSQARAKVERALQLGDFSEKNQAKTLLAELSKPIERD